ncbi:hypothetical protein A0H81_10940 [Grifola frondosa]|uniref:RING-type domain-containing protein n=1 Tax=Grifola frondosa TaxID=5627 RepID=A0A1C7LXX2_GRIFR|nr:hypothetical protein A0H81_10940 [Grifola frondosa]
MEATSGSGAANLATLESAGLGAQGSHPTSSGGSQAQRQEGLTADVQASSFNVLIGKVLEFLGYRAFVRSDRGCNHPYLRRTGGRESPNTPGVTEWDACTFLGVWNILYIPRIVLICYLSYWTFRKRRLLRRAQAQRDAESGRAAGVQSGSGSTTATAASRAMHPTPRRQPRISAHNVRLHVQLFYLTGIFAIIWFSIAVIGVYSHGYKCRLAAPYLSWVTFTIICILYLRFTRVFLFPICRGCIRIARAERAIPSKLTQSLVDRIPLVLYIPAPPNDSSACTSPITVPSPAHAYPPERRTFLAQPSPPQRKRRFIFLRKRKDVDNPKGFSKEDIEDIHDGEFDAPGAWEDLWERGEYPLIRLEGHQSTCGICLMDFEAPKRILPLPEEGADGAAELADARANVDAEHGRDAAIQEVRVEPARQSDTFRLSLADSGEGPQPLRLLGCGHAFHKTCIDPWLVGVSGRCPYCQRQVEIPDPPKRKSRIWRRS